ncbi:hypothetical protein [Carboxylicivirga marina]|uniref:hypothetical protein n=1 Tax=Carboxylicivirga marina TaxID=2800988 RepID=UPI00190C5DE6|nr:hypothetical protein [Carboxylicivirga marina]
MFSVTKLPFVETILYSVLSLTVSKTGFINVFHGLALKETGKKIGYAWVPTIELTLEAQFEVLGKEAAL